MRDEFNENWVMIPLGDLFTFKNGLNKGKSYFGYGIPIINYMDVYKRKGILSGSISGRVSLEQHEINNFNVKVGDVFFTRTSETPEEVGLSSVLLEDMPNTVFSGFVLRARPKSDALTNEFKKYCFQSKDIRVQIISSCTYTTRALTNGKSLSKVKLYFPINHAEQQAIAEALSDADALLASLDTLIEKKRNIKQALMQQLLTGSTRLPGFSGEWKETNILELEQCGFIRLGRGQVISKQHIAATPGNYPIYSSSVKDLGLFGRCGRYMFDEEMITWSVDGGGHFFYRPKHRFSITNVCGFMKTDKSKITTQFLAFQLQNLHSSLKFDYTNKAHPSVIRKAYSLKLPSLEEQKAIADFLSDADKEIEALQLRREKMTLLKQGMMQELLTGRKRLV